MQKMQTLCMQEKREFGAKNTEKMDEEERKKRIDMAIHILLFYSMLVKINSQVRATQFHPGQL